MRGGHFGRWGDVPVDGDVRPFSVIDPVRPDTARSNRKHHFVSITYMNGFVDGTGRVMVYRCGEPGAPRATRPAATGYENHYYSQPLPDGGQENHRFEDLWNSIETVWPETVRALDARRLSPAISLNVQGMMTIMRVRIPAARDRVAIMLETKLREECKALERLGKLPPDLERYTGRFDTVPVGINPHHTLLAMNRQFLEFGDLCFRLGFEVVHNMTGVPFITSDNPVCSYDPRSEPASRMPYDHSGEVELIFPVTDRILIRGSSGWFPRNSLSRHVEMSDPQAVTRLNETTARFSYRLTIARDRSSDDLIAAHGRTVPTIRTQVRRDGNNVGIVVHEIFGPMPALAQYVDTPEKAARLKARYGDEV